MADTELDIFRKIFLGEFKSLEERRRINMPGPTLGEVVRNLEIALRKAEVQPWQVYLPILADTEADSGVRRTAVNLLHNPYRIPEDAAQQIANTVVAVMREPGFDYRLGQQAVMAASILRGNNPETRMLPISYEDFHRYFIPFVEQIPTPTQGQSQSEATLGHAAHMLASTLRFTAVYGYSYDTLLSLLSQELDDFYKAQAEFKGELERDKKLCEQRRGLPRGFYAIVHPMEHLAELMEQGALTRDTSLVELIAEKEVVNKFDSLSKQKTDLGIAGGDVPRYLWQRAGFLVVAEEMGVKINVL